MSKKIAIGTFFVSVNIYGKVVEQQTQIDLGQTKQDKCKFSEEVLHIYSGFYFFDVLPQTFYMALPVLTHSYIMSKNLAFPERIYICLVDLRGNKSETCHTNETRMRHFLVPNGNDHARRVIESILNQYLFFLHQLLILKEPSWQNHKIRENVSIQHNFGWFNSAGFALDLQFELLFL